MVQEVKLLQRCDDPRDPRWENVGILIRHDHGVELKPLADSICDEIFVSASSPLNLVVEDLETGHLNWRSIAPSDPEYLEALTVQLGWQYRLAPADYRLSA